MKERVSVTLDRETIDKINSLIKNKKFRNRSHAVEIAIEKLEDGDEKG